MKIFRKYSKVFGVGLLISYLGLLSHSSVASVGAYTESNFITTEQTLVNEGAFPAVALLAGAAAWGVAVGVATVVGFVNGYASASRGGETITMVELEFSKSVLLAQAMDFEKFDN